MTAFPKPIKREKKRKPLARKARLAPKRWGVSRSKRGTKHSRRERAWGFMAYQRSQPCDVVAAYDEEFPGVYPTFEALTIGPPSCSGGGVQFMHLPLTVGRRRGPDMHGAPGCGGLPPGHHEQIDGGLGGHARWYVALGRDGQQRLRERLRARALARWGNLTQAERDNWNTMASR